MAEQVFYRNGVVLVTQSRVVIESSTYPVNSLSAVHLSQTDRKVETSGSRIWWTIGIIIGVSSLFLIDINIPLFVLALVFSLFTMIYAHFVAKTIVSYHVVIQTSGTNLHAYTSPDRKEVEDIVNAINEAIIARG